MSDEVLNRIEAKLDKVIDDITDIKVVQGQQRIIQDQHEKNLQTHMKRSDTVEALYNHLKDYEIEPLKAGLNKLKGIYGFFGFLGLLAAIGTFILKAFGK